MSLLNKKVITNDENQFITLGPVDDCKFPLEAEKAHDMTEGLNAHFPVHGIIYFDEKKQNLQKYNATLHRPGGTKRHWAE